MRAERDHSTTGRESASQERWKSESQLGLFIQSVQDYAIFLLDPEGHVATWNRGAERLKGYTEHEIVGKHFSIFYTEEDRHRHHPQAELVIAREEGRYQEEGLRRRKDGTLFYANVTITAVRDESGQLIGFGKVTRDLTEHKLHEEQERRLEREKAARKEAEAADRAKNDLLALISHELRSPLAAMLSYTELLLAGIPQPVPEASKRQVERIRAAADHLRQLIEQILTFARVQLGQEEVRPETVDLSALIREMADLVEPLAQGKELDFPIEAPTDPTEVHTDPTKLRQILWNLLSNALNYTNQGEVGLTANATGEEIILEVRDTGGGIPAEEMERVFEPFRRADRNAKQRGGTGLGLHVAKHLSELMGGSIRLQSTVGQGTTFTVRLPRSIEHAAALGS